MNTFRLVLSSPDGSIFDDDVYMLTLRGAEGDLAVMAGHVPFMTPVRSGKIKIVLPDESEKEYDAQAGILSVEKDKTTLLSGSFKT